MKRIEPAPHSASERGQSSVPPIAVILLLMIAALVGSTFYLFLELRTMREESAAQVSVFEEQIAQLEGAVNRTSRDVGTQVQQVRGLVETTEKALGEKTQQVEQRILGRAQNLAKEIEETREEQRSAFQQVGGKIAEVATDAANKIGSLTGRVDGVAQDLDQTQKEVEQTIAELKSVKGDLGVQSGLIATNSSELAALKQLGEREYFEFDIDKGKEAERVGRIQIRLKNTNHKRGRYTIEVMADDKTIEKKNRTLLEPVQFYVIGAKIPYEIVVNQLEKNRIVGYLATPIEDGGRRTAEAASTE
jgi:hypothetical protein